MCKTEPKCAENNCLTFQSFLSLLQSVIAFEGDTFINKGKPRFQYNPQYLNFENDKVNSTFELEFVLNIEVMKELSVH